MPFVARKKRRFPRGKPNPLYHGDRRHFRRTKAFDYKRERARRYAIAEIKAAARQDPKAVLYTAKIMAKEVDPNLSYVLKQLHKNPSLASFLKDEIKKKKKGQGTYT